MYNLLDRPLSQIVLENFQTAEILENHGLDFCCKGKRTLRAACADKGIRAETIMAQLKLILAENHDFANFQDLSLSTLADYIVETHHAYVRRNLPLISGYLFKIATKHGDKFPYMKRVFVLFTQVRTELESHLSKEEEVVFPAIKKLEQKGLASAVTYMHEPIRLMEAEHEMAGTLLQKIRELTNNYDMPDGSCTTFRLAINALKDFESNLHKHVHLENNILFPKAISLFENSKTVARK
jgi:regulator of cell morphogenesis and NO signaling